MGTHKRNTIKNRSKKGGMTTDPTVYPATRYENKESPDPEMEELKKATKFIQELVSILKTLNATTTISMNTFDTNAPRLAGQYQKEVNYHAKRDRIQSLTDIRNYPLTKFPMMNIDEKKFEALIQTIHDGSFFDVYVKNGQIDSSSITYLEETLQTLKTEIAAANANGTVKANATEMENANATNAAENANAAKVKANANAAKVKANANANANANREENDNLRTTLLTRPSNITPDPKEIALKVESVLKVLREIVSKLKGTSGGSAKNSTLNSGTATSAAISPGNSASPTAPGNSGTPTAPLNSGTLDSSNMSVLTEIANELMSELEVMGISEEVIQLILQALQKSGEYEKEPRPALKQEIIEKMEQAIQALVKIQKEMNPLQTENLNRTPNRMPNLNVILTELNSTGKYEDRVKGFVLTKQGNEITIGPLKP